MRTKGLAITFLWSNEPQFNQTKKTQVFHRSVATELSKNAGSPNLSLAPLKMIPNIFSSYFRI